MDALYSLALLIALSVGGLGVFLLGILLLKRRDSLQTDTRLPFVVLICGVVAVFSGLMSASVHLIFGHNSEFTEPMLLLLFITRHRAYWLVLGLCALLFSGWFVSSRVKSNEDRNDD